MSRRCIITGASGLLGRAVFREFQNDASWEVLGLAFSRSSDVLRKFDITDHGQVHNLIEDYKVILCIVYIANVYHELIVSFNDD